MDARFVFLVLGLLVGLAARPLWRLLFHLARRGHRWTWRVWWRHRSRRRDGRPRLDPELIGLIRRMARENPLWGAPRIHGELLKLGFELSQSSVSKYLARRSSGPAPGWRAFLDDHRDEIAAVDMLSVPTLSFRRLFAFVVIGLGRRRILHMEVTDHPTARWLAWQVTEAFPWDTAPAFVIRDNDGAYGSVFRHRLRVMNITDRPIRPYSPWQNGYAERLIGSIRRERLDHLIFLNEAHLRRVLNAYADYYNADRPHLGLGKDSPNGRPVEAAGEIISTPILGGLHRRYRRRSVGGGFREGQPSLMGTNGGYWTCHRLSRLPLASGVRNQTKIMGRCAAAHPNPHQRCP